MTVSLNWITELLSLTEQREGYTMVRYLVLWLINKVITKLAKLDYTI